MTPTQKQIAIEALELAIMTVECASIDIRTGEELPWYRAAKKALTALREPESKSTWSAYMEQHGTEEYAAWERVERRLKLEGAQDLAKRLKAKAVKNADTRDPAMLPYVTDDDIDAVLKEMEKEGRPLRDSRA